MARIAINDINPRSPMGLNMTYVTQHGADLISYHKKALTNPFGWMALIPTGHVPTRLSFPELASVNSYDYQLTVIDLHVRHYGFMINITMCGPSRQNSTSVGNFNIELGA